MAGMHETTEERLEWLRDLREEALACGAATRRCRSGAREGRLLARGARGAAV